MGKVSISEVDYSVYGKCIKLENGIIELVVSVEFGPRILYFSRSGMENMLYNDLEKTPLGEPQEVFDGDIHRCYGGHRLWAGPEVMPRCYHPDNKPVEWERVDSGDTSGAMFTAAPEAYTNLEKSMIVMLAEDEPSVTVRHGIKNLGAWEIELAPWAITMLAPGGLGVMPMPQSETGYLHNRNFSFWDYTDLRDERLYLGREFLTLKQENKEQAIKLGYNNEDGWAAYFNHEQVFIKFFEPNDNDIYPDGGCCYETYTGANMLESETLGALTILEPGETAYHDEEWELHEEHNVPEATNEDEIRKVIDCHL